MSNLDEQVASQIANLERSSGRTLAEWMEIVRAAGPMQHGKAVAMLKSDHGLGHGNANLVVHRAREADAGAPSGDELVASHYSGRHAGLRPLFEAVVETVNGFGSDVELAPKKTYVSLRRRKQFAHVGPAAGHLEVGLNLPGREATERLKRTSGMATHRVRIERRSELDEELVGWLREAYERA